MKMRLFAAWRRYLYLVVNCRRAFLSRMRDFLKNYYLKACFQSLQRRARGAVLGRKLSAYVRKRSAGDALSRWKLLCWRRAMLRSTLMKAVSSLQSHRDTMHTRERREAFRIWRVVVRHTGRLDMCSLGSAVFSQWRALLRAKRHDALRLKRSFWRAWLNRMKSLAALHSNVLRIRKVCAIVEAR